MKLRYYLLIACALGFGAGYFMAPTLLPALEQALYNREPRPKKNVDTELVVDQEAIQKKEQKKEVEEPEEKIALADEEFDPLEGDEEEVESEEEAESTSAKKFTRFAPEDDGRSPVNEEHFIGKKVRGGEWARPKVLEKRLTSRLRTKLRGVTQEKVMAFLKDPETRLTIAQWELLHRADLDKLSALMKDKDTAADLEPLLNDLRWVSSFVYDSEMIKPEIALAMVRHFRQCDPEMDKAQLVDGDQIDAVGAAGQKDLKRRVAAAIAVEYTRRGWFGDGDGDVSEEELRDIKIQGYMSPKASKRDKKKAAGKPDPFHMARERYMFFKESIEQDLLNSSFAKLPDWLMHFPCGWKPVADHGTGSVSSMRWLRDNCSVRKNGYPGAVSVDYRPLNLFGDTIFTPHYFSPYDPIYHDNRAKAIRDIGSVCGGISHVNAAAANANGIPAVAMGEPGHCAYAVYVDGKWRLGFSIYPTHFPMWPAWGENTWSAFEMLTEMYEQGALTRDAQMVATMAAVLESANNINGSLKLYELSASMQPLNKTVWQNYIATAVRRLVRQPRKWLGVNEYICSSMAPKHPESTGKLLTENIYPHLLKALRTPQQKLVAYTDFFSNLDKNEEGLWDIEKLMNMQNEALAKNNVYKKKFYQMVIENVCKHPEFDAAVTWVIKAAQVEGKPFLKDVLKKFEVARETCEDDKGKAMLDAAVLHAAEDIGDIDLFNKYSAPYVEAAKKEEKKSLPEFPQMPGNLISPGALVQITPYPTARKDQIVSTRHAAALTETGGHLLSEGVRNAKLIIQLPKAQTIGGIVIIPSSGSASGYLAWELRGSMDGKEWQKITDLPDQKDAPYIRIQWKKSFPKYKYLLVTSGSSTSGINFKAFLIYDNKKAH